MQALKHIATATLISGLAGAGFVLLTLAIVAGM